MCVGTAFQRRAPLGGGRGQRSLFDRSGLGVRAAGALFYPASVPEAGTILLLIMLNLLVVYFVACVRASRLGAPRGEGWVMSTAAYLNKYLPLPLKIWLLVSTASGLATIAVLYILRRR
jgi:hypothetical protein